MIKGFFKNHYCIRGALLFSHVLVCCLSLVALATGAAHVPFDPAVFHIFFQAQQLLLAILVVSGFAMASVGFIYAPPTIGYFIGFYLYTMLLSYLWLNCFSDFPYNHRVSGVSAFLSGVLFLLPALFISSPLPQKLRLSIKGFDRLLQTLFWLSTLVVVSGAFYNFSFVGLDELSSYRENLAASKILNYLFAMCGSTILPFAFAGFMARRKYIFASLAIVLQFLLFPVTLTKLTLFAPLWLVAMYVLTSFVEFRIAVILSLMLPMLIALIAATTLGHKVELLFSIVNFRMIAIPALALDVYNDFFSRHELTSFCQIAALKLFFGCPYGEQLSVVMERTYHLGYFNASFFATEGIASVGPWLAPLVALACGLIVAVGNRVSAGLPPKFLMVSAAVLPQVFLNVPLTVALATHGTALLFFLWYIVPRTAFDHETADDP